MKLQQFILYLQRRFPPKAEILDIHLVMIADGKTGLIETVTMFEDDECDEPDGGEAHDVPAKLSHPKLGHPKLKIVT